MDIDVVLYVANVAFNTVIIAMDVAIIFVAIKTREIKKQLFLWTIPRGSLYFCSFTSFAMVQPTVCPIGARSPPFHGCLYSNKISYSFATAYANDQYFHCPYRYPTYCTYVYSVLWLQLPGS
uniref:G_PROTEIN_RECEP_F1_2 domain-containing protein n=1 Tax=Haemonchus contortus TaxID=6289 RepID=A0A7I4YYY0_HAECO